MLGAFVHAFADKVQSLEIVAVVDVAHDKNAPTKQKRRPRGELMTPINSLFANATFISLDDAARLLPQFDRKLIRMTLYNMVSRGHLVRNKHGDFGLPPNKPRAVKTNPFTKANGVEPQTKAAGS